MKLISMTDFVLEQRKVLNKYVNHDKGVLFERCENYANFLKQPLELWMFVPCRLDVGIYGEVLNEPDDAKDYIFRGDSMRHEDLQEYQQAKERCLFDGFEYNSETEQLKKGRLFLFFSANFCEAYLDGDTKYLEFIEEIADYDIQLTPTAQKQIGCDH